MTPQDILAHPPLVLDQAQRRQYFEQGFVAVEQFLGEPWLGELRAVAYAKVEESRALEASDDEFDLDPRHGAAEPRLRRLKKAVDRHPLLWKLASASPLVDLAADLVGPDVKFHSSKLNYKWAHGGDEVKWHQDIQAWPHTNFSPVTLGVYLEDTGPEQGPLAVVPGSHRGELFELYDDADRWTGAIRERDLARARPADAVELCGKAGTAVAIHCRAVHGSRANGSDRPRPMLLYVYSSADAFPIGPLPAPTTHTGDVVRGAPARHVHMEPFDCRLPPRWDEVGYGSIFTAQSGEKPPPTTEPGAAPEAGPAGRGEGRTAHGPERQSA